MEFFHENDVKENFDFFNQFRLQKKSDVIRWLFLSISFLFIVGVGLGVIHFFVLKRQSFLCDKRELLNKEIVYLQKELKRLSVHKKMNKTLKIKRMKFEKTNQIQMFFIKFFQNFSTVIPDHTWIDLVTFEHKKKVEKITGLERFSGSHKNELVKDFVKILGHSLSSREIMIFYKKLVQNGALKDCQLKHFKKLKDIKLKALQVNKNVNLFSFCITGRMNSAISC